MKDDDKKPAAKAAGELADGATGAAEPSTLQQRQLAEFNQWLYRWNNYQQHLAQYWQGRYHALKQQQVASGGGKVPAGKKKPTGVVVGDKADMKWNMRYQEREFTIICSYPCHLFFEAMR